MNRAVTAHLMVGHPDIEQTEECPGCGFDSLLTFPITAISEMGVSRWGEIQVCERCKWGMP